MRLVADIGNSATKFALYQGEQVASHFSVPFPDRENAESLAALVIEHTKGRALERVGITSVVPSALSVLRRVAEELTGRPAFEVHHEKRLPFRLAYSTPETLGTDRIAASAAAWIRYGPSRTVIVIDAGTALTMELIRPPGIYEGGIIAPGPTLQARALGLGTAQLPEVPFDENASPLGKSTVGAIQAGVLYGFIGSTQRHIEQLTSAAGESPVVVATGGWAAFLARQLPGIDYVDPDLVLSGTRLLMELDENETF